MKSILFFILTFVFSSTTLLAQQFDLTGELRSRFENKNGYKALRSNGQNAANFISQRTRLNFDFQQEKMKFKASFQNVRVWGDVSTLASDDNATALHEAWAEAILTDKVSLKLGRQEIIYDDHRIFGNVGWAQQARSHDAFLFKYRPNAKNKLDIGLALNADNQGGIDQFYSNITGYKSFQYAWYHGNFDKLGLSFLALNTGVEYLKNAGLPSQEKNIDFMQTIGSRLTYKSGAFSANAAFYLQTGKSVDTDVNASYYTGNILYKLNNQLAIGTGIEYLSGKDMNAAEADIKSFAPLFGTNHKFNGWMDYFYVGNHTRSVGLIDINAAITYKKDKFSAKVAPHFFSSPAVVLNGSDKLDDYLGTEIDITVGYKLNKGISINAGYSQMLATETMEALKGGDKNITNSWGWLMFTFKPNLFSHKADKE